LDRAQQSLSVNVPDEALVLHADPTRVAQLISNLLNNSSKYTAPGGNVELAAEREGPAVRIEVRDDGIGIPADQLEHVFDMFSQVNRALDRSQGGLGIGLALVKSLAEMHGGSVSAASGGVDRGSVFTVTLPLAADAETAVVLETASAPGSDGGERMRVLVVDDNDDAADLLALLLEQAGYVAVTARDGPSALSSVEAWSPDVVILDIGLPGMSGYEVAGEIRRNARIGSPSLIALTGMGTLEDRQKARRAGFDLHLTKPVNAELLRHALEDIRRREHTPRAASAPGTHNPDCPLATEHDP
jgi:CheY-like chemotaxis protein